MPDKDFLIPVERIERSIFIIRGHRVILDEDLAFLYGVGTKVLVQAVKRHINRFPSDFMFQLTGEEFASLRSQIVTSSTKTRRGGRRYPPYAFTEHGIAMLSSVLNNSRAISVNIEIMRTFVRLRLLLASQTDLARKLAELERKYDARFRVVFDAIRRLMVPIERKNKPIGFMTDKK
jgi:hypothetical protein